MGIFDTVTCDYPLPDPRHQDLEFQTKDLEKMMGHYTITRDGRLIRHLESRFIHGSAKSSRGERKSSSAVSTTRTGPR